MRSPSSARAGGPESRWRSDQRLREVAVLALLPAVVYLSLALLSYHPGDPGWSHADYAGPVRNLAGAVGAWIADLGFYLFGGSAYVLPFILALAAWRVVRPSVGGVFSGPAESSLRLIGSVLLLLAAAALAHLHFYSSRSEFPANAGGVVGQLLGEALRGAAGSLGATLFGLAALLAGATLFSGISWLALLERVGGAAMFLWTTMAEFWNSRGERSAAASAAQDRESARKSERVRRANRAPVRIETPANAIEKSERATRELQIPLFSGLPDGALPPLALLDIPQVQPKGYSPETLEALSRQVEVKLKDFRIDARVVDVFPGPVITRFEMEPAAGVRGGQIANLDKDIARGLSVVSVRVVDVIPGKSVIGLEIPNAQRETVFLSEILRSKEYDASKSPLTLALGKDIGGKPTVVDLGKMPHLLVAGTTGAGKSVALNAMVLSLLYKATARDVRILMIDPKMLELSVYQGIPHLLAPVVTDMKEAANALRWCVAEMERRYRLLAAVGVRNLAGFNRKVRDAADAGQPLRDPLFVARPDEPHAQAENLEALPYLVVLIDEFADMMMIVGKKVEELIARLAQKARAAGIHLILATQRPSVDVITGLIKANIPTRIAFQVSSKIDSRTILDQSGAETLLGHGDMLYLPPGTAQPERVHGAFVSDEEVHRVVAHLKSHAGTVEYMPGVVDDVQSLGGGQVVGANGFPEATEAEGGESDALYDQAVKIVTESRRASISGVQRRLKIGYNRAARLIEEMESAGIVSAPEHNGNRTVIAPPPPRD